MTDIPEGFVGGIVASMNAAKRAKALPSGTGCQPTASTANAFSQSSIPNAETEQQRKSK